ncbi:MAG: N-acetyltransferase [Victivallaceae bacterium]
MKEAIKPPIEGLEIRYSTLDDGVYIKQWSMEPGVSRGFPFKTEAEIDDSVRFWIGFSRYKSSLTTTLNGEVCGIATLVLMPYIKVAHHALVSIIVGGKFRGQGIGTYLLNNLCHLAKNHFRLELLYLEVYEENKAINLYRRFGFMEVGRQNHYYKEDGHYLAKITMERYL